MLQSSLPAAINCQDKSATPWAGAKKAEKTQKKTKQKVTKPHTKRKKATQKLKLKKIKHDTDGDVTVSEENSDDVVDVCTFQLAMGSYKRVARCPKLDGKSLISGRKIIKLFEDGWKMGTISEYRPNRKRSNCAVVWEDDITDPKKFGRNQMLTRAEYL